MANDQKREDYKHLTGRRIRVSDAREAVDLLTGALQFVPGVGTVIDVLGDAASNVGLYVYNMASSPYLPGRDFHPGRLLMEAGVYGLTGLAECVEGVNDLLPAYSITSRFLDRQYQKYLEGREERERREPRRVGRLRRDLATA